MNGADFISELRDEYETALSRIGSSKWLYALTDGEMDAPSVRAAASDEFASGATVFAEWADSEDHPDAADLFESVAETEADHRDAVDTDEGNPDARRPHMETLAGFEDTQERVAGLLARTIVVQETTKQMVGFFVGSAKTSSADTFRGIRGDYDEQADAIADVLDAVCVDDEDWERAQTAANAVLDAAYDDYVDTLESMGVKPKNVC